MNLKLKTTLCAGFGMYVRQNFHLGYDDRFRGDIGWLLVTIPYGTSSLHCQMHLQMPLQCDRHVLQTSR